VGEWTYGLVYNYVRNKEDAEELCQDVLLAALDSLSTFRNKSSIKTWVCSIAVNKCKDFLKYKLRLKRRHQKISLDIERENGYVDYAVDEKHPGFILESREEIAFLMNAIDSLPGKQKDAIILCKLDKRSHKETAEILALSPKAIESLISRAKKNLKAYIGEKQLANYNVQINRPNE
jgi:RNA polymerase sigma-70 factor (ECF subfamily)